MFPFIVVTEDKQPLAGFERHSLAELWRHRNCRNGETEIMTEADFHDLVLKGSRRPSDDEMRYIVGVDFDGVVHNKTTSLESFSVIPNYANPVPGVANGLRVLQKKGFKIVIFSGRSRCRAGREEMREFLDKFDIPFDKISEHKPGVNVMIDDHAITFRGDWEKTVEEVANFQSWNGEI